jgi:hypothetical protein
MKKRIAVATVQGKAYFSIVKKLKEKEIPFLSLIPGETIPTDAKVIITTEEERHLVNHEKILIFDPNDESDAMIGEALKVIRGKKAYDRIVVGIDPGEVFGLAVISDGKISETKNCFSVAEVLSSVKMPLKNVDVASTEFSVIVGNGVPQYRELLETLDTELPPEVVLVVVSEAGTNRPANKEKHRRGLRDIASAIRIAGRQGHVYSRRQAGISNN